MTSPKRARPLLDSPAPVDAEYWTSLATSLDTDDSLAPLSSRFHHPPNNIYLCGNSLGLQPVKLKHMMDVELTRWATLGVEGHFTAPNPWAEIEDTCNVSMARIVGCHVDEVVVMNSLTVNLHLMMASFYRPTVGRDVIVVEEKAFPSDEYAVVSAVQTKGGDANKCVVHIPAPRGFSSDEDVLDLIDKKGSQIALIVLGGVNYYSGYVFDLKKIASKAHDAGILLGVDLAHAAGNVQLHVHDWGIDFAVWCTYKYLNSGPGGIGCAFIHKKHHKTAYPLAGWWGSRRNTRFEMNSKFEPADGAAKWQLSNPSVLCFVALRAALDVFDEVTDLSKLFMKSQALVRFATEMLSKTIFADDKLCGLVRLLNEEMYHNRPHGSQLSLQFSSRELAKRIHADLTEKRRVVCDFRAPDVVRFAAVPLYNSFADVCEFVKRLKDALREVVVVVEA